ncbi:MAG TPA: hypothetical protein VFL30_09625, partial [Rhodanobacteraceae bacterium]|nr:hypothetical protein [Rhodanobacteraceae bacterium]
GSPMHRRAALIAVLSTGLVAACADMSMQHIQSKETILEDTLKNYAATIRWGDMLQAQAFVDPAYRQAHPMTDLDMQRYRQVQVTAYNDQPAAPINENEVGQTVEIGLVNINTQAARSVIDRQVWRYDEKQKHWWLMTGLPDITRHE